MKLVSGHRTQNKNLYDLRDCFPFPDLTGPAVARHLNSGFPKPLAPKGTASQSYQLPPVADLLRPTSCFPPFRPDNPLETARIRIPKA